MPSHTVQFVITSMSVQVTLEVPENPDSEDPTNDVIEAATESFNHWLDKVGDSTYAVSTVDARVHIDSMEWEVCDWAKEE